MAKWQLLPESVTKAANFSIPISSITVDTWLDKKSSVVEPWEQSFNLIRNSRWSGVVTIKL